MLRKRCNLDRRHLDDRIRAGGNTDLRLLQSRDDVAADSIFEASDAVIRGEKPHSQFEPVVSESIIDCRIEVDWTYQVFLVQPLDWLFAELFAV